MVTLRRREALLLAPALGLLAGCGSDGEELERLAGGAVVLAFGDSLTYGTGAPPMDSYPAHLARLIGREVVNAGVPGEVSEAGLRRLPRLLEAHRPALTIICHGGNDILRRLSRSKTADNLRAMVSASRSAGAQVVLIGVPDFGLFLSSADFYGEVAKSTGVPLENDALSDILADNGLKADRVHPNAAGYTRLAEAIEALLRRGGAV